MHVVRMSMRVCLHACRTGRERRGPGRVRPLVYGPCMLVRGSFCRVLALEPLAVLCLYLHGWSVVRSHARGRGDRPVAPGARYFRDVEPPDGSREACLAIRHKSSLGMLSADAISPECRKRSDVALSPIGCARAGTPVRERAAVSGACRTRVDAAERADRARAAAAGGACAKCAQWLSSAAQRRSLSPSQSCACSETLICAYRTHSRACRCAASTSSSPSSRCLGRHSSGRRLCMASSVLAGRGSCGRTTHAA